MATFIDEGKMLQDNSFLFEKRLKSPLARFLETTPTLCTYFHLIPDETTVDTGFRDVASILGNRSPLRFHQIKDFPLYGMEQILLQLQETDQGMDSSYEGEVVIPINSIKPVPNDFFTIPYLKDYYLFRVTDIQYDNTMPDNFYKINFKLEEISQERTEQLHSQVTEKYTCMMENIGTEETCILKSEVKDTLDSLDTMFNDIANLYKTLYYSERHNCFLGDMDRGQTLYDPYMTAFINKNSIFNKKNNLECLMLSELKYDNKFPIKYEKSIYRFIERRDYRLVNQFYYDLIKASNYRDSSFGRWHEDSVMQVDMFLNAIVGEPQKMLSEEMVESIKLNGPVEVPYAKLIQDFLRKKDMTISDIPLNLHDELLGLGANLELFFFTPIVLYIIKTLVHESLEQPS